MRLLTRFIAEEDGTDLIEYALLTMSVGMCAAAAFEAWRTAISGIATGIRTSTNCGIGTEALNEEQRCILLRHS
jgi:Flp pilus assembly pilin Flp